MIEPQLCKSFSELLLVKSNMNSAVLSPLCVPGPDGLSISIIPVIALTEPAINRSISTIIFSFILSLILSTSRCFHCFLYFCTRYCWQFDSDYRKYCFYPQY